MKLLGKALIIGLALVLVIGSLGTVNAAPPWLDSTENGKGKGVAQETPVAKQTPEAKGKGHELQGPKEKADKPDDGEKGKEAKIKASNGSASLSNRRGISGTVVAKSAESITLDTKWGQIEILVNADTKYKVPGKENATLADIPVNARVAIHLAKERSPRTALKVHLIPGKPIRVHRVGKVTAFTSSSITIQDKKGETSTFTLTSDTKYKPEGRNLAVGDLVTVVAKRLPSEATWTATAIVIHKPKQD